MENFYTALYVSRPQHTSIEDNSASMNHPPGFQKQKKQLQFNDNLVRVNSQQNSRNKNLHQLASYLQLRSLYGRNLLSPQSQTTQFQSSSTHFPSSSTQFPKMKTKPKVKLNLANFDSAIKFYKKPKQSIHAGVPVYSEIQSMKRNEKFQQMKQEYINARLQEEEQKKFEKERKHQMSLEALQSNLALRRPASQTVTNRQNMNRNASAYPTRNGQQLFSATRPNVQSQQSINPLGIARVNQLMEQQDDMRSNQSQENQRSNINFVIQKVGSLIQQKFQEGNFNLNVNQLETAICEVISPNNQSQQWTQRQQNQQLEEEKIPDNHSSQKSERNPNHLQRFSNQNYYSSQVSNVSSKPQARAAIANNEIMSQKQYRNHTRSHLLLNKLPTLSDNNNINKRNLPGQEHIKQNSQQLSTLQQEDFPSDRDLRVSMVNNMQAVNDVQNTKDAADILNVRNCELEIQNLINQNIGLDHKSLNKVRVKEAKSKSYTQSKQPLFTKKNSFMMLNLKKLSSQSDASPVSQKKNPQQLLLIPMMQDHHQDSKHSHRRNQSHMVRKEQQMDLKLLEILKFDKAIPDSMQPQLMKNEFQLMVNMNRDYDEEKNDQVGPMIFSGIQLLSQVDEIAKAQKRSSQQMRKSFGLRVNSIKSQIVSDSNSNDSLVKLSPNNRFFPKAISQYADEQKPKSDAHENSSRQDSDKKDTQFLSKQQTSGSQELKSQNSLMNRIGKGNPLYQLKILQNAITLKQRNEGSKNNHVTLLTLIDLERYEIKFMEYYYRQKQVQKSLMKSLTGQVDSQQVRKAGVYIEEAQLADSILYLYWKQRMSKQYYVFCKSEIIDRLDLHIDEEKMEEQIVSLKIDLKIFIKEQDQTPEKKENDNSLNEILAQIEVPFIIQSREKVFLDLQYIAEYFKDTVMIAYKSCDQESMIIEFPFIKSPCSKVIINIANNEYFAHRYYQTIEYFNIDNKFGQVENEFYKERKAARFYGNHKIANWEVHCSIRDYIFQKSRITSTDIIKILFQTSENNIFFLLFDSDDDYELQLTIDTIVHLTNYLKEKPLRRKLLRDHSPKYNTMRILNQKIQKESLQTSTIKKSIHSSIFHDDFFLETERQLLTEQEHDFLPIVRKDAIRKNFEVRKISRRVGDKAKKKQESFILQFRREKTSQQESMYQVAKDQESSYQKKMMEFEYSVSEISQDEDRSQQENDESSSVLSLQEASKAKIQNLNLQLIAQNNNKSFSQKSGFRPESSNRKKLSMNKLKKSKMVQENQLISQFYRECIIKLDEKKQFMFELFVPVEKKNKMNANKMEQQNKSECSEDGLQTDNSMRDQELDKFADYDLDIQRQQFKKFMQEQKEKQQKNSVTDNQELKFLKLQKNLSVNTLHLKGGKQSLSQLQQYTTIGNYYKNLTKKGKKASNEDENNQAAEVISGDEFEEDDQDNFYIQMQNNLQIMEMLKEVGVGMQKQISKKVKTLMSAKSMKTEFWKQKDKDASKVGSDMESLFNASNLNNSDNSINVQSCTNNKNRSRAGSYRRASDNQSSRSSQLKIPDDQEDFYSRFQKQMISKFNQFRMNKKNPRAKNSKLHNSDYLRRNLYMKDQNKIQNRIIYAVEINDIELLAELLPKFDLSIDNYIDKKGNRLLSSATQKGQADVVKLLLHYGSDPNIKNKEGNTPLHFSINYKFNKITDMLLQYGADETIQNKTRRNPWEGFE